MLYTIITLNGRGFTFEADSVEEDGEKYLFSLDGAVVASFLIKGIAGYYSMEQENEDNY